MPESPDFVECAACRKSRRVGRAVSICVTCGDALCERHFGACPCHLETEKPFQGPPRKQLCKPCRNGEHELHHEGIWRRANGSLPVICLCPKHEAKSG